MCKLQIIKKVDSQIVSDIIYDCSDILRLSINNVPYYLCINNTQNLVHFTFTFFDKYDIVPLNLPEISATLHYGKSTGRLYELSIPIQDKKIPNKEWEQIKNEIFEKLSGSSFLGEIKTFLKVLQSSYIVSENNNDTNK